MDAAPDSVADIFGRLADRPPDAWDAALDLECRGDPELRRRVHALLQHLREPLPMLRRLDVEGRTAGFGPALALTPTHIGEFRILGLLGQGGMGAVYLAEQERPSRRVALKVLLPFQSDSRSARRLQQEAEVLGRLHHPGIAEIHAAGMFESPLGQQPYFAMELVDGVDLLQFCQRERLGLEARCELVAMVADAVHHAHERGVVHRDLKPANILVTRVSDRAFQPKVLDFGIARLAGETNLLTRTGGVMGTLAYMSPEQFAHGAADARSDVYALGVILYELVSGRLPLDVGEQPMHEVARILRDVEPEPLTSSGAGPRDLGILVACAMAKDPGRRFGSAAELAADIRRFLTDEPIRARPSTIGYQVRKFVQRNRGLVGAVAAVFLTLVVATVVSVRFAWTAQAESQRAQRREYSAQLTIAHTFAVTDPQAARSALQRVAPRAGFEWRVFDAELRQSWVGSVSPPGDVSVVAVLGDGRALHVHCGTAIGVDNAIVLRDARGGRELRRWQAPGPMRLPAIAGTGSRVAAVTDAPRPVMSVWDVATDDVLLRTQVAAHRVEQLELSADGRFLLVLVENEPGQKPHQECVVVDVANGRQRRVAGVGRLWAEPTGDAFWIGTDTRCSAATCEPLPRRPAVAGAGLRSITSEDGRWLCVTQMAHRNISVHGADGQLLHVLPGHRADPQHLALHTGLGVLATCSDLDGTIMLWDLMAGRLLQAFALGASRVAIAGDGRQLLAATEAGAQWVDRDRRFGKLVGSDYITSGALDPTGRLLAFGDTSCELWLVDLESMRCIGRLNLAAPDGGKVPTGAEIEGVAFDDAGRRVRCMVLRRTGPGLSSIVTVDLASWSLADIRDWPDDAEKPRARAEWGRLPQQRSHWSAFTTPDGWHFESPTRWAGGHLRQQAIVASSPEGDRHQLPLPSLGEDGDDALAELRLRLGSALGWRGHSPAALDESGRRVAFGLLDGSFVVLELESLHWIVRRRAHLGPVTAVEWLPDGSRLCTGGVDATVRFWDTVSWEEMAAEKRHDRTVERLLADPDGRRLWSLSADRTIVAWDTLSEPERRRIEASNADARRAAHAWVDRLWEQLGDRRSVAERIGAEVGPADARWPWVMERQIARVGGG